MAHPEFDRYRLGNYDEVRDAADVIDAVVRSEWDLSQYLQHAHNRKRRETRRCKL